MTFDPKLNNDRETICCREYAYVTFKFKFKPELIEHNQIFIFRSGNVHGVGLILATSLSLTDLAPGPNQYAQPEWHQRRLTRLAIAS